MKLLHCRWHHNRRDATGQGCRMVFIAAFNGRPTCSLTGHCRAEQMQDCLTPWTNRMQNFAGRLMAVHAGWLFPGDGTHDVRG